MKQEVTAALYILYGKFHEGLGTYYEGSSESSLHFPQCFQSYPEQILPFGSPLICRLQMVSIWTGLKFCCLVKC